MEEEWRYTNLLEELPQALHQDTKGRAPAITASKRLALRDDNILSSTHPVKTYFSVAKGEIIQLPLHLTLAAIENSTHFSNHLPISHSIVVEIGG